MEVGEIVVLKKKKSRAGLDGMRWGAAPSSGPGSASGNALEEVTNVPSYAKEAARKDLMRLKGEENGKGENGKEGKWWSIGRGRKGSEGKKEEKKEEKDRKRAKCAYLLLSSFSSLRMTQLLTSLSLCSPAPGPNPTFAQASTVYVPPRSMSECFSCRSVRIQN